MPWKKSSAELIATFYAALPSEELAERRKMFGYPCAFVGGQMFTGLHEERMIVRLAEQERAEFLALAGARIFEPMPGRTMKEYAVVPPQILSDAAALRRWVAKAFEYAASLPTKERKPSRRGAAKGTRAVRK
jgi:TfoX/Sxy family transcriptional regulator of competence genes